MTYACVRAHVAYTCMCVECVPCVCVCVTYAREWRLCVFACKLRCVFECMVCMLACGVHACVVYAHACVCVCLRVVFLWSTCVFACVVCACSLPSWRLCVVYASLLVACVRGVSVFACMCVFACGVRGVRVCFSVWCARVACVVYARVCLWRACMWCACTVRSVCVCGYGTCVRGIVCVVHMPGMCV